MALETMMLPISPIFFGELDGSRCSTGRWGSCLGLQPPILRTALGSPSGRVYLIPGHEPDHDPFIAFIRQFHL